MHSDIKCFECLTEKCLLFCQLFNEHFPGAKHSAGTADGKMFIKGSCSQGFHHLVGIRRQQNTSLQLKAQESKDNQSAAGIQKNQRFLLLVSKVVSKETVGSKVSVIPVGTERRSPAAT